MKMPMIGVLGVALAVCVMAVVGCAPKSESEQNGAAGVGERTGIALDAAAENTADATSAAVENTVDAAEATADAAKDAAEQTVEKSGELLEDAGAAAEEAGEEMQN